MRNAVIGTASKVYYRPMEVAVRWAGLQRHEARILRIVGDAHLPISRSFPRWPLLRLNAERLQDAVLNHELPSGHGGITSPDPLPYDDPDLTLRHVDLRRWLTRFYPNERPGFLFDYFEQSVHPGIGRAAIHALMADRSALELQLLDCTAERDALRSEVEQLGRRLELLSSRPQSEELAPRSESTYLNIIGGLLTLLLGSSPAGIAYSSFHNLESVINALLAHHGGRPGMGERTLRSKLAQARRHLDGSR